MAAADDALAYIEPPASTKPLPLTPGADDALMSVKAATVPPPPPPTKSIEPPTPLAPTITGTPGGTNGIVPSRAPSVAAEAAQDAHLNVAGPITPQLVIQAGLPAQEADNWAALGNWMTKGEAHTFGTLYGGKQFSDFSAHPKDKGWSGEVGPDGQPTSAAGIFQDQQGTWHIIQQKYGLNDFSAASQVGGNLRYASDLYQQKTGRNLLADFKAGNTPMIEEALKETWPSLGHGSSGSKDFSSDPAFQEAQRVRQEGIDETKGLMKHYLDMANQAAPGSEERRRHLDMLMQHSEELQRRYEKLGTEPPKPQSPFEAAGEVTPLLIGLVTAAGAFTRRPALGAINALGSALGGLKQGNDEQYKQAVDLWKHQSEAAEKSFKMQNDEIQLIMDDRKLTEAERHNKMSEVYLALGLNRDYQAMKEGRADKAYQYQIDRRKLEVELREKNAKAELDFARARQAEAGGNSPVMVEYNNLLRAFPTAHDGRQPDDTEKADLLEQAHRRVTPGTEHPGSEADVVNLAVEAEAKKRGVSKEELPPDVRKAVTMDALQERARSLSSGRSSLKPEQVVKDLNDLVATADDLTQTVQQHPNWVGFQGRGRHLWESTLGQIPGMSLPEAAELEAFRDKLRIFQANLVRPLLGAHYFTGIGAQHIEEIAKGLERFSSPTTTEQSLKAIKDRLVQQAQGIRTGAIKPEAGTSELTGGLVRPVPPALADEPDGTTVNDTAGHTWKKQGNQMVPMVAQ